MSHWTLHTGAQYDEHTITISWFDHNNVGHEAVLTIAIAPQDKPRTLIISVDGRELFVDPSLPQSELRA